MVGPWQVLNNEDTANLTDCDLSDLTDLDLDRQQADCVKNIQAHTSNCDGFIFIFTYIYIYIYLFE